MTRTTSPRTVLAGFLGVRGAKSAFAPPSRDYPLSRRVLAGMLGVTLPAVPPKRNDQRAQRVQPAPRATLTLGKQVDVPVTPGNPADVSLSFPRWLSPVDTTDRPGRLADDSASNARWCTTCGSPMPPDSAFCGRCGAQRRVVLNEPPVLAATAGYPGGPVGQAARPGAMHGGAPPPRGRPRVRLSILVAVTLLVLSVGGVSYALSSRLGSRGVRPSPTEPVASSSTLPTGSLRGQAAAGLDGLITQSVSERSAFNLAYRDALNCGPRISQDAQVFQNAAAARHALLAKLASLPGKQELPAQMLADLASAWRASAQVDQDYYHWATAMVTGGCVHENQEDPWFKAASAPNQQGSASKTAFVDAWNPIAQQYGLTTYTAGEL